MDESFFLWKSPGDRAELGDVADEHASRGSRLLFSHGSAYFPGERESDLQPFHFRFQEIVAVELVF